MRFGKTLYISDADSCPKLFFFLAGDPHQPIVNSSQDLLCLNTSITQPGTSAVCLERYNVMLSYFDRETGLNTMIKVEETSKSPTTVELCELSLCLSNYTVTVIAFGNGGMSEPSSPDMPEVTVQGMF